MIEYFSKQLPNFAAHHVTVVGDVMLDRYWHGDATRISPEAPVPVVLVEQVETRPGGAANVALNLAALGLDATLVGVVGDDQEGRSLESDLVKAGIQCGFQVESQLPTTSKLRVLGQHQQLIRMDFERKHPHIDTTVLQCQFADALQQTAMVVLSDYGKGVLHDPQVFIRKARAAKVPVLVDPKSTDFSVYRGATMMTPNRSEFERVVGPCVSQDVMVSKALHLLAELDMEAVLITLGAGGMLLVRRSGESHHLTADAHQVFDVTGAGDTVIAVLAASLAAGSDLLSAVSFANTAAGVAVGKLGTSAVSLVELQHALAVQENGSCGVMSMPSLMQSVRSARLHGRRIVMTNGCFDILHAGHIDYLKKARAMGDYLLVAVNDDASVTRLKGASRPVNSVEDRMLLLSALRSVDWVVSFSEDTPEALIQQVLPDVLVKGGDYVVDTVVGADVVMANGGRVEIVSLTPGRSTTSVIEQVTKLSRCQDHTIE